MDRQQQQNEHPDGNASESHLIVKTDVGVGGASQGISSNSRTINHFLRAEKVMDKGRSASRPKLRLRAEMSFYAKDIKGARVGAHAPL